MRLRTFVIAVLLSSAPMLRAEIFGPEYPPPGGVTWVPSGPGAGSGAGETFTYSGFNPTQYAVLYWGPYDVSNVSNVGQTPADMQFQGLVGGSYEFTSTATWTFNAITGTVLLPTRMLLTVSGLGPEDTQGDIGASSPNASYPLFQVTGNFSATFVFQADYQGNWIPVNDFQNSHNNLGPMNQTSVDFEFFNTAVAPEPGSFLLIGMGFALLALKLFRMKSSQGTQCRR